MSRRNRLDLMTPAEKAILNAIDEVEKVGVHPRLTDVVIQLTNAKDNLSDFIDQTEASQPIITTNSPTGDPSAPPVGPGH